MSTKTLIILPGNSPKNKAWGEGVAAYFGSWFDSVYQQQYDHWENGNETIDFEREAEKLREVVSGYEAGTEYYIFAKSFGTVLTFLASHKGYIAPTQCVFFGVPLNLVERDQIFKGSWEPLEAFRVPAIAFLNDKDPVADHTFTSTVLAEYAPRRVKVMTISGDNHTYDQFASYEEDIRAFLHI